MEKYIALPIALKVFRHDYKEFAKFKTANVYLNKIDAVIEHMRNDYFGIKKQLITIYHTEIRYIGKTSDVVKYRWRKGNECGVTEYTSEQLKDMTSEVMQNYLINTQSDIKERPWY
ncbi:hypothetical protein FFL34_00780 [Lentibacillus cibarius]|uniref:Uncharacterized protein n=2 Tax=Lentibacillus cibarius TaxID=2583219 RepID=A0A5S3QK54_9BACI|nr:hypothetical protein FFL34_00780 [Lentibacillus cibarius]